jgi:hypothetical protein
MPWTNSQGCAKCAKEPAPVDPAPADLGAWVPGLKVVLVALCTIVAIFCGCATGGNGGHDGADVNSDASIIAEIEGLISMRHWQASAPVGAQSVTNRVRRLGSRRRDQLNLVIRRLASIEGREREEVRLALLNLMRYFGGIRPDAQVAMKGDYLFEASGLVFWAREPVVDEFLDDLQVAVNPKYRPESPLPPDISDASCPASEPRPLILLAEVALAKGDVVRRIDDGGASGVGVEIGVLAQTDNALRAALIARARQDPPLALERDILSVALATCGAIEGVCMIRRWTEESLSFDESWSDRRQLLRSRAYRMLAGSEELQLLRREVEATLADHSRRDIRGVVLDEAFLREWLPDSTVTITSAGLEALLDAFGAATTTRGELSTMSLLGSLRLTAEQAATSDAERRKLLLHLAALILHTRSSTENIQAAQVVLEQVRALEAALQTGEVSVSRGKGAPVATAWSSVDVRLRIDVNEEIDSGGAGDPDSHYVPPWISIRVDRKDGLVLVAVTNRSSQPLGVNMLSLKFGSLANVRRSRGGPSKEKWIWYSGPLLDEDDFRLVLAPTAIHWIPPGGECTLGIQVHGVPREAALVIDYQDPFAVNPAVHGFLLRSLVLSVSE